MTAVILQPGYLPWLGFFDQMVRCDLFIFYDDVQYTKQSWRNRNRIKSPQGIQWLTVPVLTKGKGKLLLRDVQINNAFPWRRKHLQAIRLAYQHAPYFDLLFPEIDAILSQEWRFLLDLDIVFIQKIMQLLHLKKELKRSSSLSVPALGRTERLIALCQKVGADTFLEGELGKAYLDQALFQKDQLRLKFHHYCHPVYPQLWGEFVPYLSVIDLLFQKGEASLKIIQGETSKICPKESSP